MQLIITSINAPYPSFLLFVEKNIDYCGSYILTFRNPILCVKMCFNPHIIFQKILLLVRILPFFTWENQWSKLGEHFMTHYTVNNISLFYSTYTFQTYGVSPKNKKKTLNKEKPFVMASQYLQSFPLSARDLILHMKLWIT